MNFEEIKNRLKSNDIVKVAIILILLITFVRGVIYATVFPVWQAPDEQAQFEYIDFFARKHLPLDQNAKYKKNDKTILKKVDGEILDSWYELRSWRYISWFKESDWLRSGKRLKNNLDWMDTVITRNPPGYPLASLLFYVPAYFKDIKVRVYAIRMLSVILSVLVVYLGYKTAKELFPEDMLVVLGTPLFITFVPMFTHMSGAVNPDNLANFSASLFIFYSVKILKKFSWLNLLILFFSVFIGIFTKRTTFFTLIMFLLIPVFILIASNSKRFKSLPKRISTIFVYFTIAVFIGLFIVPFISSKLDFYPITLNSIMSTSDSIVNYFKTKPIGDFIYVLKLFSESFWASFAWGIRISELSYSVLWYFTLIPPICFFFSLLKNNFRKTRVKNMFSKYQKVSIIYLSILFTLATSIIIVKQAITSAANIPGRYLFPVIIPVAIFCTLGLSQFIKNKKMFLLLMFLTLFLFDLTCLLVYVIPFYYKTPQNYNLSFISALAANFNKPFILNSVNFYIIVILCYLSLIVCLTYYLFKFAIIRRREAPAGLRKDSKVLGIKIIKG